MKLLYVIGLLLLLAVAAFSAFGFLATYEQTRHALSFRIGYAALFIGCLFGVGLFVRSIVRR